MTLGRQKSDWDHTASIMTIIHNILAEKPATVESFHPHMQKSQKPEKKESIKSLKWMFK